MLREKIYLVLILFLFSFSSISITNQEITDAIRDYLEKNNVNHNFFINKRIKLPNCKKPIKIKKKFNTFKTLEIICEQNIFEKYKKLKKNLNKGR